MANTIAKQTLVDGEVNLVVKVSVTGDGSGEETGTTLIDVSSYSGAPSRVKMLEIQGALRGFAVTLEWNATANLDFFTIPAEIEINENFQRFGGIINNGAAGVDGDINISTTGLGAADEGSFILHMRKS